MRFDTSISWTGCRRRRPPSRLPPTHSGSGRSEESPVDVIKLFTAVIYKGSGLAET